LKTNYFEFLKELVDAPKEYSILLRHLYETEFYPLVPNDDNRCADGQQLRNNFIDEVGLQRPSSMPEITCNVLEMMIGLSNRLEFELMGGRYERPASKWFWVLVDNIGLTHCTDAGYKGEYVNNVVSRLLDRQYMRDGRGGLFPLQHPHKDQRRVEIWYQMNAWVIENYPI